MRFNAPLDIRDIAQEIGAELFNKSNNEVWGLNEIHKVESGDITFVDYAKYYDKSLQSAATFIIIDKPVEVPEGKAILVCAKPFEAYNNLALKYRPAVEFNAEHQGNNIHPSVVIEPGVVLGHHITIGEGSRICANAVIHNHSQIGKHVIVQSGAHIGNDAFYFKKENGIYNKWHSVGRVILEDYVDIGALCTINKGVSGDTIVGRGSKLDTQVHLGHGVVIGPDCLIAAQVGIAGKTHIGARSIIYGQAGIAQNIVIGEDVIISAKSGVSKSLEGGKSYFGIPAEEFRLKMREFAIIRRLVKGK